MDDQTPPGEPDPETGGSGLRPLLGILFVLLVVAGAIYMIDRMRAAATLGDCAFTHAPQCRALIDR